MIVIVTYNGLKWIDKCLQSCEDHPIVVVDNNSSDSTVDFIKQNYPKVHLIEQEKNLGFGQANNIGISYALNHGAHYVFLLNQDAYLIGDCLERLIEIQQKNMQFGIVSPIHLNGDGTHLDYNFSKYAAINRNFYSDYILNKSLKNIYEVPFVNAAGWLISRKCLETVGGFDPIFFHYGEDDNYCHRVRYHQLKIGIVTETYIKHDRVQKNIIKSESLSLKERKYKVEYANPARKDFEQQFSNKLQLTKRSIVKNKFMLRFSKLKSLEKHLKMLLRIQKEISNTRKIISKPGTHFLKINE
ncbi:glycosyltransferase family 2 protein [Zunongwangia sp. HGR-M22]|uniref:glycosyltransferase family 2 protein n=1 Tax=Zunongwangia sp. HGR-M22 TaxID=3015168 RepID=UPI0022DD29A0|nr:glycosyltransferase family 2 protein [Zunongwangia sp. HGR-M22]WBL24868.1 glycosyltransferase family 2 protein [Zunongwangia sp. HGR-M22]